MTQISKSPSYLIRNSYSYCYRRTVPKRLRPLVGRSELRYSLKTGYLGLARHEARHLSSRVQKLFYYLSRGGVNLGKLLNEQVQAMVDQYIKESLEEMECTFLTSGEREGSKPFDSPQEVFGYTSDLDFIKNELIANVNLGDYSTGC